MRDDPRGGQLQRVACLVFILLVVTSFGVASNAQSVEDRDELTRLLSQIVENAKEDLEGVRYVQVKESAHAHSTHTRAHASPPSPPLVFPCPPLPSFGFADTHASRAIPFSFLSILPILSFLCLSLQVPSKSDRHGREHLGHFTFEGSGRTVPLEEQLHREAALVALQRHSEWGVQRAHQGS